MTSPHVRVTRAFVDAVDDHTARLLFDQQIGTVPVEVLPADAHEGSWIELRVASIPPPGDVDSIDRARRRLSENDDGGDLKLGP